MQKVKQNLVAIIIQQRIIIKLSHVVKFTAQTQTADMFRASRSSEIHSINTNTWYNMFPASRRCQPHHWRGHRTMFTPAMGVPCHLQEGSLHNATSCHLQLSNSFNWWVTPQGCSLLSKTIKLFTRWVTPQGCSMLSTRWLNIKWVFLPSTTINLINRRLIGHVYKLQTL